jgi:hypothetical protein
LILIYTFFPRYIVINLNVFHPNQLKKSNDYGIKIVVQFEVESKKSH